MGQIQENLPPELPLFAKLLYFGQSGIGQVRNSKLAPLSSPISFSFRLVGDTKGQVDGNCKYIRGHVSGPAPAVGRRASRAAIEQPSHGGTISD